MNIIIPCAGWRALSLTGRILQRMATPRGVPEQLLIFLFFYFFLINATAVQVAELAGEKIEARLLLKQWQVGSRQVYIINQNSHI